MLDTAPHSALESARKRVETYDMESAHAELTRSRNIRGGVVEERDFSGATTKLNAGEAKALS
jgi:hypothetical protein